MAEALQLGNGDWVIAYYAPNQVITLELLDSSLEVVLDRTATTAVQQDFRITPLSWNGGFTLTYTDPSAGLQSIDFDDTGASLGAPRAASALPDPAPMAFTSDSNGPRTYMVGGGTATINPVGTMPSITLVNSTGSHTSTFTSPANVTNHDAHITALSNGGYALAYIATGAAPGAVFSNLFVTSFTNAGGQREGDVLATLNGGWSINPDSLSLAGLPDGGFAVVWQQVQTDSSGAVLQRQDYYTQFGGDGHAGDFEHLLGAGSADAHTSIQALPDGRFAIQWNDPTGPQTTIAYEYKPSLGLTDPPTPGYVPPALGPVNAPIALADSAGWTDVMSGTSSNLVLVSAKDGGYGSHVGVAKIYDATGAEKGAIDLQGYAPAGQPLDIKVAPVPDGGVRAGFFEVSYAGSTDYEIYNAMDQLVLVHNAYTSQTAAITPLLGGGYVLTDPSSSVFGLFDSQNHNIGWLSTPADAAGAPVVHAMQASGFAFTYAGSTHFDLFDKAGAQTGQGDLGAAMSSFDTGFASANFAKDFQPAQFGFVAAWLSADGGQYGLATSLDIQAFDATGQARGPVITLTQDLDPWHTHFDVLPTVSGANILWSQGGGVFGARYANGTVGDVHAAAVGDLSQMTVANLGGGDVGLVWMQDGDIWAEIFDPGSGAVTRGDLGAAVGDLSTVHTLGVFEPPAAAGMAVSWHTASGVEAAVLDSLGHVSAAVAIAADLVGVDQNAHALAVYDQGGSAMLQPYGLSAATSFFVV